MKKKERIKQLTRERDHARALACEYEEMIAEYQRIEPLRFSKRDADVSRDVLLAMVNRLRRERGIEEYPPFNEETFLRRARIVMDGQ